jgi:DNA-binding NarL/FixJ family response regulator
MTHEPIRVVIVDDQAVVRVGLRMIVDAEDDLTVVAEAGDGLEAVQLSEHHRPDVVLMDVRMPRLDGIEATRRIVAAGTASAVVIITTFDDEEYLLESVRAGAVGFLLKDAGSDLIAAAIRTAWRGDALIDPSMTRALLQHRIDHESGDSPTKHPDRSEALSSLTEREKEVLSAVARGLSNAAIASSFFLSETTVKTHIRSILSKTATQSRVEAAVLAYETGFVVPGWLQSDDPAAP